MNSHQIYKSEGGYRIAFALWGDNPITDSSCWFESLDDARIKREKRRLESQKELEIERAVYGSADEISSRVNEIESKYKKILENAQPIAREDDPE